MTSCPWLYSIHLNKVCKRCVVLTIYDRHRCQTIAKYTGKFSPHLKVKLEIYPCPAEHKISIVLLNRFLKTLISWFHLEATESILFSTLIENTDLS